jgi:poly-gamma-glutamate synthase PgsB/CapB
MIPVLLLVLVMGLLTLEAIQVRRSVRRLSLRIHVNGTRGKSAVVEYIAAGLRASGRRTMAKITGIQPTLILPDGSRQILTRHGPARVQEQIRIISTALRQSADVLVLECMSVKPELQALESRVFKPDISVLTNIRDDHREELGSTPNERLGAYRSSLPSHATIIMGDRQYLEPITATAATKGSSVTIPVELTESERALLPRCTIPQNIELALTVCQMAGADRQEALGAMLSLAHENQHELIEWMAGPSKVRFLNCFAANDTASTQERLDTYRQDQSHHGEDIIVLLNTRSDRPVRSALFASWCATVPHLQNVIVTGSHIPGTRRALRRSGIDAGRVVTWREEEIARARIELSRLVARDTLVIGVGNIAGAGFALGSVFAAGSTASW